MKILLAGGGTGGHFFPLMAVADALNAIAEQEKIAKVEIVFASDSPYDENLLLQKGIRFKKIPAGKIRRYFSLLNIIDVFKTGIGLLKALWSIYLDFPDVIFSKGGYASFPVVFVARILGIPLIIHESDTVPGRVNRWSAKFAKRIAISFPQTIKYFPKEKTALTGNPVRKELLVPAKIGAKEFFKLEEATPVIMIFGGSQGSQRINDNFLDIISELVKKYQIIHQAGKKNFDYVKGRADVILENSEFKSRYQVFGFLDLSMMRMAYGASDIVVARAGSASIFEIAASGLPSILIPLANSAQNHQKENAFSYASLGAADVIEESNLSPSVLRVEIERILGDKEKMKKMSGVAKKFVKPDAAEKLAREIIGLALEHA
ncbi:MAG: UDP diphospho-muramoyl pentapeptide beta-N acetylglucosaminyl transferase [Parcubacteria group bacterium Athens0714_24]|nr:MAG: UDP diphospho-muramoyl pentapeptide beta-N acetylglucosaminyl transferase [Parcubacteria group bacterium Athens0714_24]